MRDQSAFVQHATFRVRPVLPPFPPHPCRHFDEALGPFCNTAQLHHISFASWPAAPWRASTAIVLARGGEGRSQDQGHLVPGSIVARPLCSLAFPWLPGCFLCRPKAVLKKNLGMRRSVVFLSRLSERNHYQSDNRRRFPVDFERLVFPPVCAFDCGGSQHRMTGDESASRRRSGFVDADFDDDITLDARLLGQWGIRHRSLLMRCFAASSGGIRLGVVWAKTAAAKAKTAKNDRIGRMSILPLCSSRQKRSQKILPNPGSRPKSGRETWGNW